MRSSLCVSGWLGSAVGLFCVGCSAISGREDARTALSAWGQKAYDQAVSQISASSDYHDLGTLKVWQEEGRWLLSLHCDHAPLHLLLRKVLISTDQSWRLDGLEPVGWVSAHLERTPIEEAIPTLLSQSLFEAVQMPLPGSPMWVIRDRQPTPIPSSSERSTRLVTLFHQPAASLETALLHSTSSGLLANNASVQTASGACNALFLAGDTPDVEALSRILRQADQAPPVVYLDAWFIQGLDQLLEEISTQLPTPATAGTAAATGRGLPSAVGPWSQITAPESLDISSGEVAVTGGSLQAVFSQGVRNPSLWNLMFNLLVSRLRTQRCVHLRTAALSGQSTSIQAGRNGYILVKIFSNGVASGQTEQVSAASHVTITPTVLPSGEIRMTLAVGSAAFVPSQFNLVAETRDTEYTTVLQIPSGSGAFLGGCTIFSETLEAGGWNGMNHVPIARQLTGAYREIYQEERGYLVIAASCSKPSDWGTPLDVMPAIQFMDGPPSLNNLQVEGLRP